MDEPEIRDLLDEEPSIVLVEAPLRLDDATNRDQVLVTLPQLSADRRIVAFTAMVDGLRIGGALTALDIVRAMF